MLWWGDDSKLFFYKYFNKYSSNCSHQKKISKEIENVQ